MKAHESPAREFETTIKALMRTIDRTELGSLCSPSCVLSEMFLLDLRAAAESAAGPVNPDSRIAVSSTDPVWYRSDAGHPVGCHSLRTSKEGMAVVQTIRR